MGKRIKPPCKLKAARAVSEAPCCKCGGKVIEFSVPNALWNMVIRQDGRESDKEYLCFACWNGALIEYIKWLDWNMRPIEDALQREICPFCGGTGCVECGQCNCPRRWKK